jgi:RHS repeat-associated protein
VITGLLVNGVPSNTGPVGATLTIQGNGFGNSEGFSIATLNGSLLAGPGIAPINWSNTSIQAYIPQAASSGPVIVTLHGEPASNSWSFTVGAVITNLSSTSGLPGTQITINGQGFGSQQSGQVAFKGTTAATSGWTDVSIVATIPIAATEGSIVVTPAGGGPSNPSQTFTPTPSITSLSTYSGVGGTVVTIGGNAFGLSQAAGNSTVTFDGTTATISNGQWTDTSIAAIVPSAGTTGNVVVTVNSVPSAGVMFTYTPTITSLSPTPILADGTVTVGGTNFGASLPTDVVTFNGIAATTSNWTNNSIQAVVPGGITGSGTVVVSVNGVASKGYAFSLESAYNFSVTYAPDGDVLSTKDTINGNWVYAYDGFNRLTCSNLSSNGSCASPTSGTPTFTYNYDRYGNRWQQNGPNTMLLTFNTNNNNQMDGYSYDAAGNLLNDRFHSYTYDAESRVIQVDEGESATYVYDADGRRVQKITGTVAAQYLLDLDGNTVTELNSSGIWTRGEVYAGGRHLATYGDGSSGTTYFIQTDWLGSERARVLPNGDVAETCSSLPFGDGQICSGAPDPTPNHFTGKERDSESGLDNFGARYDASSMGRFMSPDPVFISADRVLDPQSLNLYAYVRNNPLSLVDPTGLDFYLGCSQEAAGSCQYVQNGGNSVLVQGQMVNGSFQATDVDMNKQGDPSAGYSDQFGNDYTGTFDQNNGVSFTNTTTGATSSGSQFIDGSDATQVNGAQGSAFQGIQGNFFDACGGSCQGRATLTGTADAFRNMKAALTKQGRFATLVDGLSLAHPFISDQWKGGPGGYAHLIKAPGYLMDMHFEGSAPGAGLTGFVLHMAGTVKDIANGNATQERGLLTPGKDPDEQ